jgi:hypothetical protein
MNVVQAKKISLHDLLTHLGYTPWEIRKAGNEVWYKSPFRNESEASFKIKLDKNIWYDFGEGKGGNVLDFVMKFKNCDLKDALIFLGNIRFNRFRGLFTATSHQAASKALFDALTPLILEIKPVCNYILKEYLKERCIPPEIGFKYLQQIKYKVDQKEYFGLGFPNRSGGWEIRCSVFKGCIGKKDISIIESDSKKVSVFEGFMDFLSYLTLSNQSKAQSDIIVLNSVAFKKQAIEFIRKKKYNTIHTYFDNDKAGKTTSDAFIIELPKFSIIHCNYMYESYNDLNDYLRIKKLNKI